MNISSKYLAQTIKMDKTNLINMGNNKFCHRDNLMVAEPLLDGAREFIEKELEVKKETNIYKLFYHFKNWPGARSIKSATQFFSMLRIKFDNLFHFFDKDRILPLEMAGRKIKSKRELISDYLSENDGRIKKDKLHRYFSDNYSWMYKQVLNQISANKEIEIIKEFGVKYLVMEVA